MAWRCHNLHFRNTASENINYVLDATFMFKGHHIYYAENRRPDEDVYADWKNMKDWKSGYRPNWRSRGNLFWRIKGWEMETMATFENLKNHVLSKQIVLICYFFLSSGNSNKNLTEIEQEKRESDAQIEAGMFDLSDLSQTSVRGSPDTLELKRTVWITSPGGKS